MNAILRFDCWLFRSINGNLKNPFLDHIMLTLTMLGGPTVSIVTCLVLLLYKPVNVMGQEALLALTMGHLPVQFFKKFFSRPRPYLVWDQVNLQAGHMLKDFSFPSGHTASSSSIITILTWHFPDIAVPLITLAALIGISRIYLGQHYPTDVLIGAVLGVTSALLVLFL